MKTPAVMRVVDVARESGFSTKTVLRALNAGELAGSKVRSRWLVWPEDFRAWIDAGRQVSDDACLTPPTRRDSVGSAERLREIERAA